MNTAPAIDTTPAKSPTPADYRRFAVVYLCGAIIDRALREGPDELLKALCLIMESKVIFFDSFLKTHAETLATRADNLLTKLGRLLPSDDLPPPAKLFLPGEMNLRLQRFLQGNPSDEAKQDYLRLHAEVYDIYADTQCFMLALDSHNEDSSLMGRIGAPAMPARLREALYGPAGRQLTAQEIEASSRRLAVYALEIGLQGSFDEVNLMLYRVRDSGLLDSAPALKKQADHLHSRYDKLEDGFRNFFPVTTARDRFPWSVSGRSFAQQVELLRHELYFTRPPEAVAQAAEEAIYQAHALLKEVADLVDLINGTDPDSHFPPCTLAPTYQPNPLALIPQSA
jgi:hypothetical protein